MSFNQQQIYIYESMDWLNVFKPTKLYLFSNEFAKSPNTHWIQCWPGPRIRPEVVENRKILHCLNQTQAIQSMPVSNTELSKFQHTIETKLKLKIKQYMFS